MKASPLPGPMAPAAARMTRGPRAFTLLEMCIVLFIIALLLGVTAPALQSAFVEQAVRREGHELALAVKTAMLQSAGQHRVYVIDLTANTFALHPADADAASSSAATSTSSADAEADPVAAPVTMERRLDAPAHLLVNDPDRPKIWVNMPPTPWVFQPGELCPASTVRLARGDSWMEMSFNALTGNVENEKTYFP